MASETVRKYALTPSQTITATFDVAPITSSPVPTVTYYSDAGMTTVVSGPTNMTQVSSYVWTAPVPNLAAQTLYIKYSYKAEVGGTLLTDTSDILILATAGVGSGTGLCTLAEVKLQLNKTTTADDTELQSYIDAATAAVEDYCGVSVQTTVTNEIHRSPYSAQVFLRNERITSVTSLTEYLGTTARTYTGISTPASAALYTYTREGTVLTRIGSSGYPQVWEGDVYVTYVAGFDTIPPALNLAARIIVQHLWRTQNGGAGLPSLADEDTSTEPGQESAMPNRARELLDNYRRVSGVA